MIIFFKIICFFSIFKCQFIYYQLFDRGEKVQNRREKFRINVIELLIIEYKNKFYLKFIKLIGKYVFIIWIVLELY